MRAVKSVTIDSERRVIITYLDGSTETLLPELICDADAINALTEQVGELKGNIDNITSVKDYIDLNDVTITTGKYIKSDGTIGTNRAYSYTEDYIELPGGVESVTVNRNVYTSYGDLYQQTIMVWWYDSEKTLLGTGTNTTSGSLLTSKRSLSWNNVKYIRVNLATYRVNPFIKLNYYSELRFIRSKRTGDIADDFTETGIYWIGSTMDGLPTSNIGVLTVKKIAPSITEQTFITKYNTYTRLKTVDTWKEWVQLKNPLIAGTYNYTYTTTKEQKNTGIILKANKTYRIMFVSNREGRINAFGNGNTNNLKRVYPWMNETYFTNDGTDRLLSLYNYDGVADTVSIIVCETDDIEEKALNIPKVYTVGKSPVNTYDFSSVTECFLALKDDNSPKIVEIWEGDYDIYHEYVDANVPVYTGDDPSMEYFDYCVWVPQNTHVIGKGIVRLKWMPDPAEDSITPNQCKCVSPLNVAGSCTIENIEVYCKNGRYALHNDALGKKRYYGAIQRYINCRFYKYTNDVDSVSGDEYGFTPTTGFGIDKAMHHVYENCTFVNYAEERAFYGHSRMGVITSEAESPDITLLNCVIDTEGTKAVKFGTATAYGADRILHIRVMFNSCYISGQVWCQLEKSNSSNCENCFDVQYLNCGNVSMRINDPDNEYPPKAYNTTLTMVN